MQLCCADVRIGGSPLHVVPKEKITPAEILVLRAIHGDDAVVNIRPTGDVPRQHGEEFDRLRQRYGRAGAMSAEGQPSVVLDRMFPGAVKKLPVRLKDIGLGSLERPEKAPKQESGNAQEASSDEDAGEAAEAGSGEEGGGSDA